MKVLISGKIHIATIERIKKQKNLNVIYAADCSKPDLLNHMKDTDVLISRSETTVDKYLIDHSPNLKFIIRAAVGVGNIDVEYATTKGILVMNCPGKNTNSAAELSLGLIFALLRKLPSAHANMKQGGWDRHKFSGEELRGKTIGLVGLGNVGHRVAKFCNGLDMQVLAYDPYISPSVFKRHQTTQIQDIDQLLKEVDILSVHTPLNKETLKMIAKPQLSLMKKGSFVINAARGNIIDETAVLELLESNHLAGAGIDTWDGEPKPLQSLVDHPNVVCSPHIGASTEQAQKAIGDCVFDQLTKAVRGQVVDYPVNLPNIGLVQDPLLQSYGVLAERLGIICSHLLSFNPKKITLNIRGEIASQDATLIKLGFAKGFIDERVDGYVSFVNALPHLKKIGIVVEELKDHTFSSYKSAIKVTVKGENSELTVGGTVFDNNILRLSLIDQFYFELEPKGHFIIITNQDMPGVIGDIGTFLADKKINIDTFDLSRNKQGGRAMAFIRVDQEVKPEIRQGLEKIGKILSVKTITL